MSEWLLATTEVSNWALVLIFASVVGTAVLAQWTVTDSMATLKEAATLHAEVNRLLEEFADTNGQEPSHDPS